MTLLCPSIIKAEFQKIPETVHHKVNEKKKMHKIDFEKNCNKIRKSIHLPLLTDME